MASERDCVDHLLRVAGNPNLSLPEIIALGLLVSRKWDRARTANPTNEAAVTSSQAANFDDFTPAELREFREAASRVLIEHAATLPRSGDKWMRGFWQGLASAWAYAIMIAIVAFIIKLSGSDLLTVLREVFAK